LSFGSLLCIWSCMNLCAMNLILKNQVRWLESRIWLTLCMCSKTFVACCEPMVPWMICKLMWKSWKPRFFNLTIILSNQKVIAFKCKLVCTITWGFKMCLFIFQVLLMMLKFLDFLPTYTIKPLKEIVVDQRKKCVRLHCLGDKSYPLLPWLMVPHKQSTPQFFQSLI
jgi:hypothetical protein